MVSNGRNSSEYFFIKPNILKQSWEHEKMIEIWIRSFGREWTTMVLCTLLIRTRSNFKYRIWTRAFFTDQIQYLRQIERSEKIYPTKFTYFNLRKLLYLKKKILIDSILCLIIDIEGFFKSTVRCVELLFNQNLYS